MCILCFTPWVLRCWLDLDSGWSKLLPGSLMFCLGLTKCFPCPVGSLLPDEWSVKRRWHVWGAEKLGCTTRTLEPHPTQTNSSLLHLKRRDARITFNTQHNGTMQHSGPVMTLTHCPGKNRESGVHLLAMSFPLSLRVFLSHLFLTLCLFSLCIYIYIYIYMCM